MKAKYKPITSQKQKKQAIQENKQIITASEIAIQDPKFYAKAMQEKRKNEGLPAAKYNDSFIKIFYHIDKLLTLMDDLEGVFTHNLKASSKRFVKDLESYNSNTFPKTENGQNQYFEAVGEQEKLYDLINQTHNIYYKDLGEILEKYNEFHNKDLIIQKILDAQYSLFGDYEIDEKVRKQVLRIEPNADFFNILHLTEVVTREKVLALPKLNQKTLEVLDKIFRNAQIKW